MAHPDSPAIQNLLGHNAPRLLASIGAWLTAEIRAGHIRDAPLVVLLQLLIAPVSIHMLTRPTVGRIPGIELPDLDAVCGRLRRCVPAGSRFATTAAETTTKAKTPKKATT